jgi:hypothetical protein
MAYICFLSKDLRGLGEAPTVCKDVNGYRSIDLLVNDRSMLSCCRCEVEVVSQIAYSRMAIK